jgi:hypothetical protein
MSESSHLIHDADVSLTNGHRKEIELRNLAIGKSDTHNLSDIEASFDTNEQSTLDDDSHSEVADETRDSDIVYYYICTLIHVILIEYALLVIECSFKAILYLLISLVSCLAKLFCSSSISFYYTTYQYFREGLLCIASLISLILPFTTLFIYRQLFLCKIDFDVCPLPTLLGWVDSRRFLVVCYGSGSHANNVFSGANSSLSSMDTWRGDMLFSPDDIRTWLLRTDDDRFHSGITSCSLGNSL